MPVFGARGGSRTHTGFEAHWILSPARLPIPPLLHLERTILWARRESNSRLPACKAGALDQLSYSPFY